MPSQFNPGGGSTNLWFATTTPYGVPIFTAPQAGAFHLQKGVRDSIYGPGFQDWNLALFKKFRVKEQQNLEFRAEAFDVNNHPNLSTPNLNPTSATFGQVTSKTGLARNLQLSLRYAF